MLQSGHVPVLLEETIALLGVRPGGRYVDGTLGRAGHTREIVKRGGFVLGIDRDDQALEEVEAMRLQDPELAKHLKAVKGCHSEIKALANANGWDGADGILLDLGVSSPQLDEAGRGFSFLRDGPLDMRMDAREGLSAADLVNTESEERLAEIFRKWGEEPQARRIARAIVKERGSNAFATTLQLASFIERIVGRKGGHHPATRVFQALRMEVNDEMGELERALEDGIRLLRPGGIFAIITFESLTDRTVKRFFADHVGRMVSLQQGGAKWEGLEPRACAVTKKAVKATEKEIEFNVRSRSAKLRAIQVMEKAI